MPTILTAPKDAHFFKDDNITLECAVDQFTDEVKWEKDGTELDLETFDRISKVPGGSLMIMEATIEDTGTYTCVAVNRNGLRRASAYVNVTRDLLSCEGK